MKLYYELAKKSGFCSTEEDGTPHLERPDGMDLQAFIREIAALADNFGGDAADFAGWMLDKLEDK